MPGINMQKKIELLSQKVSDYFNIEQIPMSFYDDIEMGLQVAKYMVLI